MISSTSNHAIKNLNLLKTKSKARREQKTFLVEGIKMFREIPEKDIKEIYVSESFLSEFGDAEINKKGYTILSDRVFESVSDTVTPQGILAVVNQIERSFDDIINNETGTYKKCFLIIDEIRDPGNLGTIIRTAEGAGVSGIFLSRETVDIYSPKVIRSTMGSVFRVPFIYSDSLVETVERLKKEKVKIFAAHLDGEDYSNKSIKENKLAFVIGNESRGISEELINKADKLIRIPMKGKVESLNASVCASILMYSYLVL